MNPLKNSYLNDNELSDEFCNRNNCRSCDGIGEDGEPLGYGCPEYEKFITENSDLIKKVKP